MANAVRLQRKPAESAGTPDAILLEDDIGWQENGVLRLFKADQVVTNAADIKALRERGAKFGVVRHE